MPRILIVDDDSRFRRTLRLALDSHGYEVTEAADGRQALETVAASVPDLIVLDWHLPGMDGVETCRTLRERWKLPIIMVSANRSHSKDTALTAGATDYLAKPFGLEDLSTRIESALRY